VKLLVDMNLSPSWIARLARHGFDAVHWSTIGAATAPDDEILTWANEHSFVPGERALRRIVPDRAPAVTS
jgi:predicted nuclease of predicted toxin-antitoxin system